MNRPGIGGDRFDQLRSHGELVHSYVVSLLGFGWRDVADRLVAVAVILTQVAD